MNYEVICTRMNTSIYNINQHYVITKYRGKVGDNAG